MGKKTKKMLTEADVKAGGGRFIRAFMLGSESDAATDREAPAKNGGTDENAAAQNDDNGENSAAADSQPMSSAERTKKYRESRKNSGQQQLMLMTTRNLEKRETLKALARDIEIDGLHSVCVMALRAKTDAKTLDGMRVAGDAPDVVTLGVLASHADVRPMVDGVIENPDVRNIAAAALADRETCGRVAAILRNPATLRLSAAVADNAEVRACLDAMMSDPAFLGLCSLIRQDTQLRQAARRPTRRSRRFRSSWLPAHQTFWKVWRPRSGTRRFSSSEDERQSHRRFDARWRLQLQARPPQNLAIKSCRLEACEPRSH